MIEAVTTLVRRRSVVAVLGIAALVVGLLAVWNQLPSPAAVATSLAAVDPGWLVVAVVAQCTAVFAFADDPAAVRRRSRRRVVARRIGGTDAGQRCDLDGDAGGLGVRRGLHVPSAAANRADADADIGVTMIASAGMLSGTLVALYLLLTGPTLLDQLADIIGRDQVGSLVLVVGAALLLAILRPPPSARPVINDRRRDRLPSVTAAVSAVRTVPAGTWTSSASWAAVKWAADFGVLVSATLAVGTSVDIVAVATIYLGVQLLRQFPVTPGGIGVVEAALLAGLIAAGADPAPAAAAVLVYRLCTFWLMLPVGGAAALHARSARTVPTAVVATRSDPAALGGDPDGVGPGPGAGLADHR